MDKEDLKPIVRELLSGILQDADAVMPRPGPPLISSEDVLAARATGILEAPKGALVTPLARDTAERFGVRIIDAGEAMPSKAPERRQADSREEVPREPSPYEMGGAIALGADHGGFALKERLRAFLRAKGRFEIIDCGSYDGSACDYPDLAAAVARRVALGEATFGILVDGAGIGSCMAANKFPGVLAANCHSAATAKNSREHNGANILCLGSGHLDNDAALAILDAWLSTPFGGGRHGRRLVKIRAIEQSFLGGSTQGGGA